MKNITIVVLIFVIVNIGTALAQIQITDPTFNTIIIESNASTAEITAEYTEGYYGILPINNTITIPVETEIKMNVTGSNFTIPVNIIEKDYNPTLSIVNVPHQINYSIELPEGVIQSNKIEAKIEIVPGSELIAVPLNIENIVESVKRNEYGNIEFTKKLSSDKIVSIERSMEELKLKARDIVANIRGKLKIEKSGIFLEANGENLQVSILPDMASESVRNDISSIESIELKSDNRTAFYDIKGTANSALLGFIPVTMDIAAQVNAISGEVYNIQKPWWSFLAFKW